MMTVSTNSSILISRATTEVFAYVADYVKDPTWRSGVSEMRHDPPGEVHLGMKTHERLTFAGVRTVNVAEIVEFEPGRKTAFRTIAGPLSASGYCLFEPDETRQSAGAPSPASASRAAPFSSMMRRCSATAVA